MHLLTTFVDTFYNIKNKKNIFYVFNNLINYDPPAGGEVVLYTKFHQRLQLC